jgi:uncharacterized protein (TIGR03067 family)
MRISRLAGIVLITVVGGCRGESRGGDHATAGSASSRSIVGRWALDSLVINGQNLTGMARTGPIAYYTLNSDGTFQITRGDSVVERGTYSQDTTVSPMIFDHNADHAGTPGPHMLGIFAITGDTLVVTIMGPNPEGRHPTAFHSALADSSWLLVYHRAPL